VQLKPWDQLSLNERVDSLRREFDEFDRIERNNVDARAVRHREIQMRMAQLEEAQRHILSRLARLETLLPGNAQ
jgi:hypothetical protein